MVKVTINGKQVEVKDGITILQACEEIGIEIPRFCYHEKLAIAGNCRMCIVDVEKSPRMAASCSMGVMEGMVIHTNNEKVKKAREGVMEFLLANHPLDCPICDQGGECDLQDQAMKYGKDHSRFDEEKRAVKDKYMGPLIKTHMTRCIHCTRCVRFVEEVAGVSEMGTVGRGNDMQITTYLEQAISSEMSGNIIDLCPVGALTSKPFAFTARSWELTPTETIDVMDAVGSNIRVDSKGPTVMRILPVRNDEINEEWISDKTRFCYDGLKLQRLDKIYQKSNGRFVESNWEEIIKHIGQAVNKAKPEETGIIFGDLVDAESMAAFKILFENLKSDNIDCRQNGVFADVSNRASYLFNTGIERIEEADFCLLIGANPRYEASLVNTRIRKSVIHNGLKVYSIGDMPDQTYNINNLGNRISILEEILENNNIICAHLKKSNKPMLIIGESILGRNDAHAVLNICKKIAKKYNMIQDNWNGYNILHRTSSRVGGLDLSCVPKNNGMSAIEQIKAAKEGRLKILFLIGADELDLSNISPECKVVYIGHHGDNGANNADIILPSPAYTEKEGTYVNLEGRPQRAYQAVKMLGSAKEEWKIVKLLADYLRLNLGFNDIESLRKKMAEINPIFKTMDEIQHLGLYIDESEAVLNEDPVIIDEINYYKSNVICRSSKTLNKCDMVLKGKDKLLGEK